MKCTDLIERVLTEVKEVDASLALLLRGLDAIDKSVPTLEELNEAFAEIDQRNKFPSHDWSPVTQENYAKAIQENREWMAQKLESQGISRNKQEQALEWHRKMWSDE